jgi:hypothetical protein
MSIPETIEFDNSGKPIRNPIFRKVFVPLVILLVGLLGYGLGRLEKTGSRPPIEIKYDTGIIESTSSATSTPKETTIGDGGVYASSKGTKYYYEGCRSTISAANKVSFKTAALAEAAGYTLASGCKKP